MKGFIMFDVDGTLYRGDAPYRYYAQVLAQSLSPTRREPFLRQVDSQLSGALEVDVEDHWEAVVVLARLYGSRPSGWQKAFLKTREFMLTDACELEVAPELVTFLREMRGRVQLGCASNSPRGSTMALLKRIGVRDYFHGIVAQARKPDGFLKAAKSLNNGILSPHRSLSVGDNYKNDIAPAVQAGWATAYLSPFGRPRGASTMWAKTIEEIVPFLYDWVDNLTRK